MSALAVPRTRCLRPPLRGPTRTGVTPGRSSSVASVSEVCIRAATINLFAHHGDWERRRPALRQALQSLGADVLALQEAIVDGGYDMARELLGDGYEIVHQQQGLVGDGTHHGSSVASRWPIRAAHEV